MKFALIVLVVILAIFALFDFVLIPVVLEHVSNPSLPT